MFTPKGKKRYLNQGGEVSAEMAQQVKVLDAKP